MLFSQWRAWWTWPKAVIIGSVLFLTTYVSGVYWHVHTMPEIGLNVSFRRLVSSVYPEFVYWTRPGDRPARQFFLRTVAVIFAFIGGYHWSRIITQPLLLLVFATSAVLLPAVSLHFYQLFPRPKPWLEARPRLTLGLTY